MEFSKQDVLKKIRFEFAIEVMDSKLTVLQLDKNLFCGQLIKRIEVFSRLEMYEEAHSV